MLASSLLPARAFAQEAAAGPDAKAPSGTIITLGGFGAMGPRFEGSRRMGWDFIPLFDIRDVGDKDWLNLPRDGIDVTIFETESFRAGLVGNFRWERDTNSLVRWRDPNALAQARGFRHMGSIDLSLEGGLFAELWPAHWLRTRIEARDAFYGASGLVADLSTDLVLEPLSALTWTIGPRLSLGDARFMKSYYGVDATQSARSGLAPYDAGAGIRSVGAGSMLRYKVSDSLSTFAFVEYQRLSDIAVESPLISRKGSPDQTTFGLGTSISFTVGK